MVPHFWLLESASRTSCGAVSTFWPPSDWHKMRRCALVNSQEQCRESCFATAQENMNRLPTRGVSCALAAVITALHQGSEICGWLGAKHGRYAGGERDQWRLIALPLLYKAWKRKPLDIFQRGLSFFCLPWWIKESSLLSQLHFK